MFYTIVDANGNPVGNGSSATRWWMVGDSITFPGGITAKIENVRNELPRKGTEINVVITVSGVKAG